jgi:hypothetical protein
MPRSENTIPQLCRDAVVSVRKFMMVEVMLQKGSRIGTLEVGRSNRHRGRQLCPLSGKLDLPKQVSIQPGAAQLDMKR